MAKRYYCSIFFIFIAFCMTILLSACSAQQPVGQDGADFLPNDAPTSALRLLHRAKAGIATYAHTDDGMYMLMPQQDAAGGVMLVYVEFESAQMAVVCVRPECNHNDETCTGWFPSEMGSCQSVAIGDKIYLLFYGNPYAETPSKPQLLQMQRNGADRKVLVEFDAADLFTTPFATDETHLYMMRKTLEKIPDNGYRTTTQLIGVSLQTGEIHVVKQWLADAILWGAEQNTFFVQIALNFDNNGHGNIAAPGQGQQYEVISVTKDGEEESLFRAEETGYIGAAAANAYYQITPTEHTITARSFLDGTVRTLTTDLPAQLDNVFSFSFVDVYDGTLFFIGIFPPDGTSTSSRNVLYALDEATGAMSEIALYMTESGGPSTKLVLPVTKYKDMYFVRSKLESQRITAVGADGQVQEYEALMDGFALIDEQDLLAGKPVFRELEAVNFIA